VTKVDFAPPAVIIVVSESGDMCICPLKTDVDSFLHCFFVFASRVRTFMLFLQCANANVCALQNDSMVDPISLNCCVPDCACEPLLSFTECFVGFMGRNVQSDGFLCASIIASEIIQAVTCGLRVRDIEKNRGRSANLV
jgi:hypothetical protein